MYVCNGIILGRTIEMIYLFRILRNFFRQAFRSEVNRDVTIASNGCKAVSARAVCP